jgi:ferredoxin-NADP reductase
MTLYTSTLQAREDIASGTSAFRFRRPEGFEFAAGQAIDVVLSPMAGTPDDAAMRHTFSIVSAPFQDELVIATRMRDSRFKRSLAALHIGARVTIDGPFGSLALHKDRSRAAIFIAGGIGITPFVSILRQATEDRLPQLMVLLYSNRRPEDSAFLAELASLHEANPNFRLVATMTQMSGSQQRWDGRTGVIDEALLKATVGDLPKPVFYVVGPPSMVEAMRRTLKLAGFDDDDIRSEEFYGY